MQYSDVDVPAVLHSVTPGEGAAAVKPNVPRATTRLTRKIDARFNSSPSSPPCAGAASSAIELADPLSVVAELPTKSFAITTFGALVVTVTRVSVPATTAFSMAAALAA